MITAFKTYELATLKALDLGLSAAILVKPPAWTRLEPQSISGDPSPGIEARMHDPLWLIGRQWQMGEFRGEDCGTPVSVRLSATTRALTGLRHGDAAGANPAVTMREGAVFEPEIEAEPWAPPCLRDRAEAAAALIAALVPLGWGGAAQLLDECGFDTAAADIMAQRPDAAWLMIARHVPDAEAAALAIEAGGAAWLAGAAADVTDAAAAWLAWYRGNVSRRGRRADSWQADRLEYRFGLQAGSGREARTLEAPCHLGGPFEWYSVDLAGTGGLGVAEPAPAQTFATHVYATRLRYPGMPSNRMWELEDGLVNFGVTEVQPNDLARLAFLEYATIYGNDWLIAPIDLPRGVLAEVQSVSYRTTFNETVTVDVAADLGRRGRFGLYGTNGPKGVEAAFVIAPNGRPAVEGAAREEVVFARDETANVVWAIERRVEGADGRARDRSLDAPPAIAPVPPQPGADLRWTLETLPATHWVPMVPVPNAGRNGGFKLRKGSFDGTDRAKGRVLAPTPFDLFDEEVPREGVRLRRVPSVVRDEDGQLRRWIARRVSPAWGEARSVLEYDATRR